MSNPLNISFALLLAPRSQICKLKRFISDIYLYFFVLMTLGRTGMKRKLSFNSPPLLELCIPNKLHNLKAATLETCSELPQTLPEFKRLLQKKIKTSPFGVKCRSLSRGVRNRCRRISALVNVFIWNKFTNLQLKTIPHRVCTPCAIPFLSHLIPIPTQEMKLNCLENSINNRMHMKEKTRLEAENGLLPIC